MIVAPSLNNLTCCFLRSRAATRALALSLYIADSFMRYFVKWIISELGKVSRYLYLSKIKMSVKICELTISVRQILPQMRQGRRTSRNFRVTHIRGEVHPILQFVYWVKPLQNFSILFVVWRTFSTNVQVEFLKIRKKWS